MNHVLTYEQWLNESQQQGDSGIQQTHVSNGRIGRMFTVDELIKLAAGACEGEDIYADLYPGYSDPDAFASMSKEDREGHAEACYFENREAVIKRMTQYVNRFEALPDPVTVYRLLLLDGKSYDPKQIGNHWTYDLKSIAQFGDTHGGDVLLVGKVKWTDVDIADSLTRHVEYGDDENELFIPEPEKSVMDLRQYPYEDGEAVGYDPDGLR